MVEIEEEFIDCKAPQKAPNSTAMAVVALLAAIICSSAASAADDVRVRFSWKLKGEYGHLYLAQDQGFYAAENLAVRSGQVRRYEACVSFAFASKNHRSSTDSKKLPPAPIMALTLRISVWQLNCLRRCSMHRQ